MRIRLFLYDSTWFNVDNSTDAQNLLDKGAVEYTSDQIRGVEGNETWVSNDTMFQDEQGWYFHREEPVITPAQRIKEIQDAVQNLLDTTAQSKRYDDGFAICSYATSTDETFRNEAQAFIEWRDRCWRKCYEILAQFESGEIEMPSVEYVLAELPGLEW